MPEMDQPKVIISSDMKREQRVPPGQRVTDKWPVLQYSGVPEIDLKDWRFRIFGLVEEEVEWTWDEFRGLPVSEVHSDWHCVTTWSRLDMVWTGVTARDIVEKLKVGPDAKAVMIHCFDNYTTNLLLEDFLEEDVLFAWAEGGTDLPAAKGGPLRLVVPKLYAWKSAKWASGIEFMAKDSPGFWESRGYHMHGDPWKVERYSH
jgi:DMSO/TMAO reductase YedYZ molybdopterin-dependent catalytic subunit